MKEIFFEDNYYFIDSIIRDIKLDKNMFDYLITIDYFLGKEYSLLTLRLKNVIKLDFSMCYIGSKEDKTSPYTLSHISKINKGRFVELIIETTLSYPPNNERDKPLVYCLCEEVFVER